MKIAQLDQLVEVTEMTLDLNEVEYREEWYQPVQRRLFISSA